MCTCIKSWFGCQGHWKNHGCITYFSLFWLPIIKCAPCPWKGPNFVRTLKQTSGEIFLDICWTKIKNPSTSGANTEANCVARQQSDKQVEPQQRPTTASVRSETNTKPALHLKKKKKKSPSTRKRDRERLVKWLAVKRLNSDSNSNIAISNLPITRYPQRHNHQARLQMIVPLAMLLRLMQQNYLWYLLQVHVWLSQLFPPITGELLQVVIIPIKWRGRTNVSAKNAKCSGNGRSSVLSCRINFRTQSC